jgi:hypothetical protein
MTLANGRPNGRRYKLQQASVRPVNSRSIKTSRRTESSAFADDDTVREAYFAG